MGNGKKKNGHTEAQAPTDSSSSNAVELPRRKPDGTYAKGQSGNPAQRFPKGVSGNPGGRTRLVRETWAEWLEEPNTKDPSKSNVRVGVEAVGALFLNGDIAAAREARSAVEGSTVNVNYQSEIVQWLEQGIITVEEVQAELDAEEARAVLLAAGKTLELPSGAKETTTEEPSTFIEGESEVVA